ncbi:MAG: hypothetical protein GHCLOJNM_04435 [bacterium]|nr:hypothetical protein [bacterium]
MDRVADPNDILNGLHPIRCELRDVDQPLARGEHLHEGPEGHDPDHLALVDLADLHVAGQILDHLAGLAERRAVGAGDHHLPGVVHIDLDSRLGDDPANGLASRPDDVADLFDIDLHHLDPWGVRLELRTRSGQRLGHLSEDMESSLSGLFQRLTHDLARDPADLDVHLQGGNAPAGTGHLKIHVPEVVLQAEDVGENREAVPLLDQAHGDPGHRFGDRHARVHERKTPRADRCHR